MGTLLTLFFIILLFTYGVYIFSVFKQKTYHIKLFFILKCKGERQAAPFPFNYRILCFRTAVPYKLIVFTNKLCNIPTSPLMKVKFS